MNEGPSAEIHLRLMTRSECELCEYMEMALRGHSLFANVTSLEFVDVDEHELLKRRYGLRIPVLLDAWQEVICEGRFDERAFEQWFDELLNDNERG